MNAFKLIGYLSFVVLCLFTTRAQSQQPTTLAPLNPAFQSAMQKFHERAGHNWVIRSSSDGNRVLSLVGSEAVPGKAKGLARVQEFLRQNAPLFGLAPELNDLKPSYQHTSAAGQHFELQQTYQGLPVENGRLSNCP
jgi:hypothetical protein